MPLSKHLHKISPITSRQWKRRFLGLATTFLVLFATMPLLAASPFDQSAEALIKAIEDGGKKVVCSASQVPDCTAPLGEYLDGLAGDGEFQGLLPKVAAETAATLRKDWNGPLSQQRYTANIVFAVPLALALFVLIAWRLRHALGTVDNAGKSRWVPLLIGWVVSLAISLGSVTWGIAKNEERFHFEYRAVALGASSLLSLPPPASLQQIGDVCDLLYYGVESEKQMLRSECKKQGTPEASKRGEFRLITNNSLRDEVVSKLLRVGGSCYPMHSPLLLNLLPPEVKLIFSRAGVQIEDLGLTLLNCTLVNHGDGKPPLTYNHLSPLHQGLREWFSASSSQPVRLELRPLLESNNGKIAQQFRTDLPWLTGENHGALSDTLARTGRLVLSSLLAVQLAFLATLAFLHSRISNSVNANEIVSWERIERIVVGVGVVLAGLAALLLTQLGS